MNLRKKLATPIIREMKGDCKMEKELQTYQRLWLEKEGNIDSKQCKELNKRFGEALDKLGLEQESKLDLADLCTEMNAAYEEQGFVAGFQTASRMCIELFKASLGGGIGDGN